jgi:N-sulfoglucosamine sulfohydrolase
MEEITSMKAGRRRAIDVAQILNLLFRRIVFGRPFPNTTSPGARRCPRIANPRYSRFQICATAFLTLVLLNTSAAAPRPHIVVFLADDHGFADSEVYGSTHVRTPNMLRVAAAGMTFTNAFVASPSCAPSRAALLTGLMPARNGAEVNHSKPRAELKKLPAWLQELGYEVVAFGKVSHYKHTKDYGFDHFGHDAFHEHEAIPAALKWLRERSSTRPLCLFVGSNWPHVPWPDDLGPGEGARTALPPTQADTPETRRAQALYFAAVARMDAELGLVYDAAREKLGADTFFLHTSDHGAQFPFGKWNCYDAGIRTSLIVSWPGVIKAATRTGAMVSWIDILPTLIELGGGAAPADIDGRSFGAVLRGEKIAHRERVFTTHSGDANMNVYPMRSVRTADWKFILNLHPEFKFTTHIDLDPRGGAKPGYWGGYWESWTRAAQTNADAAAKVRRYHQRPREELYDLGADPHEQHNLAGDPNHAARVAAMRGEVESWMKVQRDRGQVP